MLMAGSLRDVQLGVWQAFQRPFQQGKFPETRLVALLFAPPNTKIAKDDLIPRWDDFHHRSGDDVDFFCAGYGSYLGTNYPILATTDRRDHQVDWQYAPEAFDIFVREVEAAVHGRWQYTGEVDLLLFNGRCQNQGRSQSDIDLDLSTLLVLKIDAMLKDKVIPSAASLFEAIIHYAPRQDPKNPALGFSYAMGKGVSVQWFKEAILKYVPGAAGVALVRGKHYVPHFA